MAKAFFRALHWTYRHLWAFPLVGYALFIIGLMAYHSMELNGDYPVVHDLTGFVTLTIVYMLVQWVLVWMFSLKYEYENEWVPALAAFVAFVLMSPGLAMFLFAAITFPFNSRSYMGPDGELWITQWPFVLQFAWSIIGNLAVALVVVPTGLGLHRLHKKVNRKLAKLAR